MNFHPMDWLVPIQAIGWTLLHFLWQGGLVGLAYAIMRRLVAADRCDIRYAAGLLALAIIAICPLLTFALVLPAWPAAADIVPGPMMDVAPGGVVAAVSGPGFALDRWLPWLVLACATRPNPELDPAAAGTTAAVYGSVFPAVWSFQLALRSRGLGSVITTLHLHAAGEVARILGIPAGVTQACLLPVAYTRGVDFRPAVRRPVTEVVYWDCWGR